MAIDQSWPWASWTGAGLCTSVVMVSEGLWGLMVAKLVFPCRGISVSSECATDYPKCMAKWGVAMSPWRLTFIHLQ